MSKNKCVNVILSLMIFFIIAVALFVSPVCLSKFNHNAGWNALYFITTPIGYWLVK